MTMSYGRPEVRVPRPPMRVLFVFAALVIPPRAWGYIDPGSGSYLLQVLLAFFFGALFVMKGFWKKAARKIARIIRKDKPDERQSPDS